VKHRFLLDVMVIYHAIKGVDEAENPDQTSSELVRLIGDNCHTVVADNELAERYSRHLKKLLSIPSLLYKTAEFLSEVIFNSSKFVLEASPAPELPPDVKVPPEDKYVVRAALISHPIVVTAEQRVLRDINGQSVLVLRNTNKLTYKSQ
jgi:hypothetical protein